MAFLPEVRVMDVKQATAGSAYYDLGSNATWQILKRDVNGYEPYKVGWRASSMQRRTPQIALKHTIHFSEADFLEWRR
jgi:hypothetical protein